MRNAPADTLAGRMKAARKKKGMLQADLAEVTGICLNSIRNYERGASDPTAFALLCIADVLDVSLDWLMARGGRYAGGGPI